MRNINYRRAKKGETPCALCKHSIVPYMLINVRLRCHAGIRGDFAVGDKTTCDTAAPIEEEFQMEKRKKYLREKKGWKI